MAVVVVWATNDVPDECVGATVLAVKALNPFVIVVISAPDDHSGYLSRKSHAENGMSKQYIAESTIDLSSKDMAPEWI